MREMIRAAARFSMLAAALAFVCSGCAGALANGSPDSCQAYLVSAIEQHITVTVLPRSCAGQSHGQVNETVARSIRQAVGPLPKAAARRLAVADSRYLAHLVRPVSSPGPASLAATPARSASAALLRLSALACWVLTATAGSYLLARAGLYRRLRSGRLIGPPDQAVMTGHAGMAVAGLLICAAFAVTSTRALAWIAVALIVTAAGLGMATLVTALPEPVARLEPVATAAPGRQQSHVAVIAVHGVLATVTIVLVILAAIGNS
jgi:manganese efflux pump family protein